ncbi:uncharacterized protein LOC122266697 [Penaeus japonicus]|uniref:uncharacterized protein LOC122266697 n=1 Tax=Penaeus japonicus TaxID=27405 RepID=UPI001C70FAE7|nr:uncharacterized protein LOC122266697 [Penaeus japonicus]
MAGTLTSILFGNVMFFVFLVLFSVIAAKDTDGPQGICSPISGCLEGWVTPRPDCIDFECRCPNGSCTVFTRTPGSSHYSYYCGTCGTLGSECATSACQGGAVCRAGYCHCEGGTIYREVCVREVPVPTSTNSLVLILVLVSLLILNKLISSRETLKKCLCRSRYNEEEETVRCCFLLLLLCLFLSYRFVFVPVILMFCYVLF